MVLRGMIYLCKENCCSWVNRRGTVLSSFAKKESEFMRRFLFFSPASSNIFFVMLHKNITSFYIEEHSALDRKSRSWNNMIVVMPSGIYYSTAAQSKFYVSEMEKADRHSF